MAAPKPVKKWYYVYTIPGICEDSSSRLYRTEQIRDQEFARFENSPTGKKCSMLEKRDGEFPPAEWLGPHFFNLTE